MKSKYFLKNMVLGILVELGYIALILCAGCLIGVIFIKFFNI